MPVTGFDCPKLTGWTLLWGFRRIRTRHARCGAVELEHCARVTGCTRTESFGLASRKARFTTKSSYKIEVAQKVTAIKHRWCWLIP
jgi:hypothetical protein